MQSAIATLTAILNSNLKLSGTDDIAVKLQRKEIYEPIKEQHLNFDVIANSDEENDELENLPQYSLKDVSKHCTAEDCWIVIKDMVYDITTFIFEHPAGSDIILEQAGTDATRSFQEVMHSKDAHTVLEQYCIGVLIEEERLYLNNILPYG
ncbi:Uncharacterised protein g5385 [Pycnogonum litorale]